MSCQRNQRRSQRGRSQRTSAAKRRPRCSATVLRGASTTPSAPGRAIARPFCRFGRRFRRRFGFVAAGLLCATGLWYHFDCRDLAACVARPWPSCDRLSLLKFVYSFHQACDCVDRVQVVALPVLSELWPAPAVTGRRIDSPTECSSDQPQQLIRAELDDDRQNRRLGWHVARLRPLAVIVGMRPH